MSEEKAKNVTSELRIRSLAPSQTDIDQTPSGFTFLTYQLKSYRDVVPREVTSVTGKIMYKFLEGHPNIEAARRLFEEGTGITDHDYQDSDVTIGLIKEAMDLRSLIAGDPVEAMYKPI